MNGKPLLKVLYRRWALLVPEQDLNLYYETFVMGQYSSLNLQKGDFVLDGGASVGDFSILAADAVGPNGLVVAVEPDPFYYSILQKNLRVNNVANCVTFCGALSDRTGRGPVEVNLLKSTRRIDSSIISIADLLSKFGLSHFDVVKLDIEGGEQLVFRDTAWLDGVRELTAELHGNAFEPISRILEANGLHPSVYGAAKMVSNIMSFLFRHTFDFVRTEAVSHALASRRLFDFLRNPIKPPLLVSRSVSPIRVVHAKRFGP